MDLYFSVLGGEMFIFLTSITVDTVAERIVNEYIKETLTSGTLKSNPRDRSSLCQHICVNSFKNCVIKPKNTLIKINMNCVDGEHRCKYYLRQFAFQIRSTHITKLNKNSCANRLYILHSPCFRYPTHCTGLFG